MKEPRRQLTLLDAVSLMIGVIIGAGIYQNAPMVARATTSSWGVIGLWALGGLLSMMGAMSYAELATAYPRAGGDYVYLTRAYGRWAGFLFGWCQLVIVRPGDIAALALVFANHGHAIVESATPGLAGVLPTKVLALAGIAALTAVNAMGVRFGKWMQNALTAAKVAGIVFIVVVGYAAVAPHADISEPTVAVPWELALILVLFTFGGWNEMAYLAAELKNPTRNIARGLVIGSVGVTLIYLVMNGAFLHTLGHAGLAATNTVAQDTVGVRLPRIAGVAINVMICVSSLGAVSGLVFTGSRISYALGRDYRLFAWLGQWHPRYETPLRALLAQGVLASSLIVILGDFLETLIYTSAAVYAFYTATCLSVLVLRVRDPDTERPYRVTGYPVTVLAFAATAAYLMVSALRYRPMHAVAMGGLLLLGLFLYALHRIGRLAGPQTIETGPESN